MIQYFQTLRSNKKIYIFGTGRGSFYVRKLLNAAERDVIAYVVSNKTKPHHHDKKVLDLNELDSRDDFILLVSILDPKNAKNVVDTLRQSFENAEIVYQMDNIISDYMLHVAHRKVDPVVYSHNLGLYYAQAPNLVCSPTVSVVLTEKCTLNCLECGAWVPDIHDPKTFSDRTIIESVRNYCSAFDIVHHVALQGGEPLLHKNLSLIIDELSTIPNLLFVDVVSNGTITPKINLINSLFKAGAAVIFSDYGSVSINLRSATRNLEDAGIYVDFYDYDSRTWGVQKPVVQHYRTKAENNDVFRRCVADKYLCCSISNGSLYRCTFSGFTSRLHLTPQFPADYVTLLPSDGSSLTDESYTTRMREEIRNIALRTESLSACDFCLGPDRPSVKAGVQIPRISRQK